MTQYDTDGIKHSENEVRRHTHRAGDEDHAATRREFVLDEPARAHLSTWEGLHDIREHSELVRDRLLIRQD